MHTMAPIDFVGAVRLVLILSLVALFILTIFDITPGV